METALWVAMALGAFAMLAGFSVAMWPLIACDLRYGLAPLAQRILGTMGRIAMSVVHSTLPRAPDPPPALPATAATEQPPQGDAPRRRTGDAYREVAAEEPFAWAGMQLNFLSLKHGWFRRLDSGYLSVDAVSGGYKATIRLHWMSGDGVGPTPGDALDAVADSMQRQLQEIGAQLGGWK